ncbi:MAG: hypothetical protein K2N48_12985 [Muribaculaceae bacterium]|nr:hypothetical protein [Muribaculaceae bacterium]
MTRFFTTSTFRSDLSDLLKVRKNVYTGIENEIYNEFIDCPIEIIRNNRDMILIEGDSIVIKLRLPDKKQRKSRKDGYRLIYLVAKDTDMVTFLSVYPKNGPSQKIDTSKEELRLLMDRFIIELSSDILEPYLPLSL